MLCGGVQGVLYSHRSNFLHAIQLGFTDLLALGNASVVLMIVPMFHANSWGTVFAGPMFGMRLVLPGTHPALCICCADAMSVDVMPGMASIWLVLWLGNVMQRCQPHCQHHAHCRIFVRGQTPACCWTG